MSGAWTNFFKDLVPMSIKPSEISDLIKQRIERFQVGR